MMHHSNDDDTLFECRMDSIEDLCAILSMLEVSKEQDLICTVIPAGLKFSVECSHVFTAKAYLKSSMFTLFTLRDDTEIEFVVRLDSLLQCLQVFGRHAHMHMRLSGSLLRLDLEDQGVITECELKTLQPNHSNNSELNFRSSAIVGRAVVKSVFLKDSLAELEIPGAVDLKVSMLTEAPYLTLSVHGQSSEAEVDFPSDSDIFIEFECKELIEATYSLSILKPCLKALAKSDQTNLRMNEEGLLSMQHIVHSTRDDSVNWVEYLIVAKEDINDQMEL